MGEKRDNREGERERESGNIQTHTCTRPDEGLRKQISKPSVLRRTP